MKDNPSCMYGEDEIGTEDNVKGDPGLKRWIVIGVAILAYVAMYAGFWIAQFLKEAVHYYRDFSGLGAL